MTGGEGRCARTAIGQIAAMPPTNVMNSRRRMYGPIVSVQSVNKKRHARFGPEADEVVQKEKRQALNGGPAVR